MEAFKLMPRGVPSDQPLPSNAPLGPPPPGQTTDFSQPVDQHHYNQMVITMGVLGSIATLAVLVRLWTRIIIVKRPGWDDAFALVALLFDFGHFACEAESIVYGLADADWNVRAVDWLTNDLLPFVYWNVVSGILFYLSYAFVKLSILALYLRILGPGDRKLRITVYVLMAAVTGMFVSCLIAQLTNCNPTAKLFNPDLPGTCRDTSVLFWVQALLSTVFDFFILIPPIPIIWNLSTSRGRKWGIMGIFCMGFAVSAISITRTVLMYPWSSANQFPDPLFGQFNATYWTFVELNFALLVINLPALSQLLVRLGCLGRKEAQRHLDHEAGGSPASDPSSEGQAAANHSPKGKPKQSPLSQFMGAFVSGLGSTRARSMARPSLMEKESHSSFPGSEEVEASGSRQESTSTKAHAVA